MSVWELLERLLHEERMYRGETMVRMKDLRSLFRKLKGDPEKGEKPKSSDPKVQGDPDPDGGVVSATYPVDPRVWGRWSPSLNFATVLAGTDKQDTQHRGQPYGGTVMKRNYGGRVVYQPGPPGGEKQQLPPSAMDRYDVLMVADVRGGLVEPGKPLNWPPGQKDGMPEVIVQRIAWSPAIGTAEERMERLQSLLAGRQPAPLARRPQPEKPDSPEGSSQPPPPEDISVRPSPSAALRGMSARSQGREYRRAPWYNPGRGTGKKDDGET